MAPHPLLLSWSSPSPPTIAHYNGTLQWHHVHSPKIGRHPSPLQCSAMTTSTPPKLVVSLPYPHHSTLGTQQWHHVHSPKIGRHHAPTIAHSNSTLQWALGMAPRPLHPAMAPCYHIQSAKVVRRLPPLLELRTPIAIAIWGKNLR